MQTLRQIAAGVAAVLLLGPMAASAEPSQDRTVDQYLCRDVVRESGANRDVAIAFLHGFLLGRSGRSQFKLDELHNQSEAFIEECLSNPNEKALDVMARVKK